MPRPGPPSRPSKYQPLADLLATHDADNVRLTFAEIETVIGSPLPVSAYADVGLWRMPGRASVRAWTAAGWEAAQLDRRGKAVIFHRLRQEN